MNMPAPINMTSAALEHVKALLDSRGKPSLGIRIGVRTKGCSGLSYTLEFADEKNAFDETDVAVLSSLADQIAVALDNARLFEVSQSALAQVQTAQRLQPVRQAREELPSEGL